MLLSHWLCRQATAKRTSARGEKTSGQEGEGIRTVQDLALVRVLEEAGAGRRARGSGRLDPCVVDLYDRRGLCHTRHWLLWTWPEDIDSNLDELAHGRSSDKQNETAACGHLNAPRSKD